jgi:hypothetical protein
MNKKHFVAGLLILIALGAFFFMPEGKTVPTLEGFGPLTDVRLKNRTIVDFVYNPDGTVSYSYLTEPVPELLDESEVPELRTENSYTKLVAVSDEDEPMYTLEAKIFSQPAYAQDVDGTWKYLEYATTTQEAFRNRDMTIWTALREVFVRTAYAATATVYSAVGDGILLSTAELNFQPDEAACASSVWSSARTGASLVQADYTSASEITYTYVNAYFNGADYDCNAGSTRTFLPFDTGAAICSDASISAASLNVYVTGKVNASNDTRDYVTVVRSSQASHSSLLDTEFNNVGGTEGIDSGDRKDYSTISTSAYMSFPLNATGRGWITLNGQASNCSATTGISCYAFREGNDMTAVAPVEDGGENSLTLSMSETANTTQDPYLSVTYTGAQSCFGGSVGATTGIKVTGGGGLRVVGGKLKMQ